MLHDIGEDAEPVANSTRTPGEIDDQGTLSNTGQAPRERRARKAGIRNEAKRLRNPRRLLLQHGSGGFGRHVAGSEAGAAGGEREISQVLVGPPPEDATDLLRFVRDEGSLDHLIAPARHPGDDRVP